MKLDVHTAFSVQLRLSQRNLLSLLAKLHLPESKRTITKDLVCLNGLAGALSPTLVHVRVIADPNPDHYGSDQAGAMTPETEELVAVFEKALRKFQKQKKGK